MACSVIFKGRPVSNLEPSKRIQKQSYIRKGNIYDCIGLIVHLVRLNSIMHVGFRYQKLSRPNCTDTQMVRSCNKCAIICMHMVCHTEKTYIRSTTENVLEW